MNTLSIPQLHAVMRRVIKRKQNREEDRIQRDLVKHLELRAYPGVIWFHVPNGGRRGAIEAANFKKLGVKPGVSDLIFFHRSKFYALELKVENGRPTEPQMDFVSRVNGQGGFAAIVNGLDRALGSLEAWGLIRPEAA